MKLRGRNIKRIYKMIITQEGSRKYQLLFLAFSHLPYEDFHLWDTVKEARPGKGRDVIYLVRATENQKDLMKKTLGDYIVSIEEVEKES